MSILSRINTRVKKIILSDLTPLRLIMGILGLVMSFALLMADSTTADYDIMHKILFSQGWAIAFFVYGVLKIWNCLNPNRINFRIFNSVFGIWLWTFVSLSILMSDQKPISSTDWLLVVPILSEIWLLAENFTKKRQEKKW